MPTRIGRGDIFDKIIDDRILDKLGRMLSAVTFDLPGRRLYPASFVDVGVAILRRNLTLADLVFSVERPDDPNDHTCLLSVARDGGTAAFRLLLGARPGVYALVARLKASGEQLARTSFRIDPTLPLGDAGPSNWLRPTDGPGLSDIGGGPQGVQNVGAISNLRGKTWRIAVVPLEYSDAVFPSMPADRTAVLDRWRAMLTTGVPFQGGTASVKSFVEESSFGQTRIEASVMNFIAVDGAFTDYFDLPTAADKGIFTRPDPGKVPPVDKQYQSASPKDWQAFVSAIDGKVDLKGFDSVFFVSPNHVPAGETFERFSWPYATLNKRALKRSEKQPDGSLASVDTPIACFVMPDRFDMIRNTVTTICHELGHNFGMDDQYRPGVQGDKAGTFRNLGEWEPMAQEDRLPHHALYHKLALGWAVDPAASAADREKIVHSIDFQKAGTASETIRIAPIEAACPANLRHGVEIRIADGRNYYFEYRRQGVGAIGDRNLIETPVVLGIDAMRDPGPLGTRPQMIFLAFDPDGDSSVLAKGEDYEQTDITAGDVPMSLRVEVIDTQPTYAEIKVSYAVQAAPNPAIRPWHVDPARWWQSPDIEVRNDRTAADPGLYANKMWLGQQNTVVAKIRNTGGTDAPGVRVRFYVKDFTVAGGEETPIGQDVQDVPADATVEFTTIYTPPGPGNDVEAGLNAAHYCIVARIQPYQTPVSKTMESSFDDDLAQSNYAGLTSVMASPASRPATRVAVNNPLDRPARLYVEPAQSHGGFISYLDHRWVRLPGKGKASVAVATEYAPEPARAMQRSDHWEQPMIAPERMVGMRAHLALGGWMEMPDDGHPKRLDGADLDLVAAFATRIVRLSASNRAARVEGMVTRTGGTDKRPVRGGAVLLTIGTGPRAQRRSTVVKDGVFAFTDVSAPAGTPIQLRYLGTVGEAPCSAAEVVGA